MSIRKYSSIYIEREIWKKEIYLWINLLLAFKKTQQNNEKYILNKYKN